MSRQRIGRRSTHASAWCLLATLPLLLTAAQVGAPASTSNGAAADTATPGATETAAWLRTRLGAAGAAEAVPASFTSTARPALGNDRAGELPWAALQAYQRAADILAEVEPACALSWSLLAAVGQVESEHGLANGGRLGDDAAVTPALLGPRLDGRGARPVVDDTDAGVVDGDRTWDRAVGPMQILPATWAVAGVDGDGDGTRSAQDLDDAALAVGVVLCAGGWALDRPAEAADALMAYNSSPGYVEQVLAVQARYERRDLAVAGAPDPQSIAAMLDRGPGTAAKRETARALRALARTPDAAPLAARRAVSTPPAVTEPATDPVTEPATEPVTEPATEPVTDPVTAPGTDPVPVGPAPSGGPTAPDPAGEPLPAEPAPDPDQDPAPAPTDDPADDPVVQPPADPTPEPAPDAGPGDKPGDKPGDDPGTSTVTGTLVRCGEAWCLERDDAGPTTLAVEDLEIDPDSEADPDLDGDGTAEPLAEELAGLEGDTVELLVLDGVEPMVVVAVNGRPLLPR